MAEAKKNVTRRGFGKTLAQAGAAAAAAGSLAGQAQAPAGRAGPPIGPALIANNGMKDQLIFGGIGIRNRGIADLRQLLGDDRVKFVAIADIRDSAREMVKATVDSYYGNTDCEMYRDPEQLLARKDINALLITTSDRWHGLMAIWAAQSGKDVYSEKPAAMSIEESYALADNVRRYGVVYQSGCQKKNQFELNFAVGLARSGRLGRLLAVHASTAIGLGAVDEGGHGWWPADGPEPDPLVFNWDKWLGPCLWRPYNSNYADRGRALFWDFHAGLLEWGSHSVAGAQWAADMEHTEPIEYEPEGGIFRGDGLIGRYTINCRYANGVKLVLRNHSWIPGGTSDNKFEGTDGWVEAGGERIVVSDTLKSLVPTTRGKEYDATGEHIREFLQCIRSRTPPRANAEATAHTHIAAHAAWICAQLNRKLTWDPAKRMFINDEEANRMRGRAYREPWRTDALATSM